MPLRGDKRIWARANTVAEIVWESGRSHPNRVAPLTGRRRRCAPSRSCKPTPSSPWRSVVSGAPLALRSTSRREPTSRLRRHRRGGEGIERLFEEDLAVHAVARHVARRACGSPSRDALLLNVESGLHAPGDEREEQRRRGARRVQSAEQPCLASFTFRSCCVSFTAATICVSRRRRVSPQARASPPPPRSTRAAASPLRSPARAQFRRGRRRGAARPTAPAARRRRPPELRTHVVRESAEGAAARALARAARMVGAQLTVGRRHRASPPQGRLPPLQLEAVEPGDRPTAAVARGAQLFRSDASVAAASRRAASAASAASLSCWRSSRVACSAASCAPLRRRVDHDRERPRAAPPPPPPSPRALRPARATPLPCATHRAPSRRRRSIALRGSHLGRPRRRLRVFGVVADGDAARGERRAAVWRWRRRAASRCSARPHLEQRPKRHVCMPPSGQLPDDDSIAEPAASRNSDTSPGARGATPSEFRHLGHSFSRTCRAPMLAVRAAAAPGRRRLCSRRCAGRADRRREARRVRVGPRLLGVVEARTSHVGAVP